MKEKKMMENKFANFDRDRLHKEYYGTAHDKSGNNYVLNFDHNQFHHVSRGKATRFLRQQASKMHLTLDYVGFYGQNVK